MTCALRDLKTAQHEAAHLVVGMALGLRPKRAVLETKRGWTWAGGVWFDGRAGSIEAWAIMYAAGVAWERKARGHVRNALGDLQLLREIHVPTRSRVRALEIAAGALLTTLAPAHTRLTCVLIEHDLAVADFATLIYGQSPAADE